MRTVGPLANNKMKLLALGSILLGGVMVLTSCSKSSNWVVPTLSATTSFSSIQPEYVTSTPSPPAITPTRRALLPTTTQLPSLLMADVVQADGKATTYQFESWYGIGLHSEITNMSRCVYTGRYGLRLTYSRYSPPIRDDSAAWGIRWDTPLAVSDTTRITFWVKGFAGGEKFDLWVNTSYGHDLGIASDELVEVSSSEWRLVDVRVHEFAIKNGRSESAVDTLNSFSFLFSLEDTAEDICVDNILVTQ